MKQTNTEAKVKTNKYDATAESKDFEQFEQRSSKRFQMQSRLKTRQLKKVKHNQ